MQNKTQDHIVQQAQQGVPEAQKALFATFYGYVMSITLRYMATREEAEELLNDVFVKFFDHLGQYDPAYPIKAWLRRMTINTCIDKLRTQKKLPRIIDLTSIPEQQVEDEPIEINNSLALLPILQKLPPRYRAVFNLYVFEDHTHKEIGSILGISEGTSKSNYARAKKILQKTLMRKDVLQVASIYSLGLLKQ